MTSYFCQRCATPHQPDFSWIFWNNLRLDSTQCKDQLIRQNTDVLKREKKLDEAIKQIADEFLMEKFKRELSLLYKSEELRLKNERRVARAQAREQRIQKCRELIIKRELNKSFNLYVCKKPIKVLKRNLKNYVYCPSCKREIPRAANICPICRNYTKPRYKDFDYMTKQRNQEIVSLLNQGIFTLDHIGKRYKVSRERIRQIYFKTTGKGYTLRKEKVVNIKSLLDKWYRKHKPVKVKKINIPLWKERAIDSLFFRYRKLDQIALAQ